MKLMQTTYVYSVVTCKGECVESNIISVHFILLWRAKPRFELRGILCIAFTRAADDAVALDIVDVASPALPAFTADATPAR